ncbi:hypothetical protein RUM43_002460 [Polyplax serrata]|uniref:Uncharacterized protein n=1 Tax=Polyplax serrata TaxID=468196 RepID=A0AAN8P2A5_POLSC
MSKLGRDMLDVEGENQVVLHTTLRLVYGGLTPKPVSPRHVSATRENGNGNEQAWIVLSGAKAMPIRVPRRKGGTPRVEKFAFSYIESITTCCYSRYARVRW